MFKVLQLFQNKAQKKQRKKNKRGNVYESISKKLKIPVGTVKSRISTARKMLSEKLQFLLEE